MILSSDLCVREGNFSFAPFCMLQYWVITISCTTLDGFADCIELDLFALNGTVEAVAHVQ